PADDAAGRSRPDGTRGHAGGGVDAASVHTRGEERSGVVFDGVTSAGRRFRRFSRKRRAGSPARQDDEAVVRVADGPRLPFERQELSLAEARGPRGAEPGRRVDRDDVGPVLRQDAREVVRGLAAEGWSHQAAPLVEQDEVEITRYGYVDA